MVSSSKKGREWTFWRHVTQSRHDVEFLGTAYLAWFQPDTVFFNLRKCSQSRKNDNIGIFSVLFNIDLSDVVTPMRVLQTFTLSAVERPAACLRTDLRLSVRWHYLPKQLTVEATNDRGNGGKGPFVERESSICRVVDWSRVLSIRRRSQIPFKITVE